MTMKKAIGLIFALVLMLGLLAVQVSAENTAETLYTASNVRNYIPVIEEALENTIPYDSGEGGKAMLYDVDSNGVQELLMLHYVEDTDGAYYMPTIVFSIYTMNGTNVIPLVENELICYIAGQPYGTVSVAERDGVRYITVNRGASETFSGYNEWLLYSLDGTSVTLNSTVKQVYEYYDYTDELDYSNSYTYIDGVRYSYDEFFEWENDFKTLSAIHYACEDDELTLVGLLEILNEIPDGFDNPENSADYNARNYISVVEEEVNNGGYADGLLYDVDGNGVEELMMVHTFDYEHAGFSIYTMNGDTVVPCVVNQVLTTIAGGPIAEVLIIEESGERFIAAHGDNGNSDGSGYRAGDWYVYSVDGISIDLETEINYYEWKEGDWQNGFYVDYSESYAYFNGTKYSYAKLEQWVEDLNILAEIGYLWDDKNALEDLLAYLKSLPENVEYNGL